MKIFNLFILFILFSCAGVKLEKNVTNKSQSIARISKIHYDIHIPYIKYSSIPVDLKEVCEEKELKSVTLSNNILIGVIPFLTAGIVQPQMVEIKCLEDYSQ